MTLAGFLANKFGGQPAIGIRAHFGAVKLIVRDMQGDAITQVGVELDPRIRLVRYWGVAIELRGLEAINGYPNREKAVSAFRGRPR